MLWPSWRATGGRTMRCLSIAILTPSLKAQVSANDAWSVVSQYSNVGEHSISIESISQKQPTQFKTPKTESFNVVGSFPFCQHPFSYHELGQSSVRAICPIESQIATSSQFSSPPTLLLLLVHPTKDPQNVQCKEIINTCICVQSLIEMNMFRVKKLTFAHN